MIKGTIIFVLVLATLAVGSRVARSPGGAGWQGNGYDSVSASARSNGWNSGVSGQNARSNSWDGSGYGASSRSNSGSWGGSGYSGNNGYSGRWGGSGWDDSQPGYGGSGSNFRSNGWQSSW